MSDCVVVLRSGNGGTSYWLGADDIAMEGTFMWNDGTPVDASTALWKNGQFAFRMVTGNCHVIS